MRFSSIKRHTGWLLVGLSLVLHFITVLAFSRQPDKLAAFTVMPIWIWGGLGIALSTSAFFFLRAPLSLVVTGIWALTVLLGADEAHVIANVGTEPPRPGPATPVDGLRPIRVLTLNAAHFSRGDPAEDIAAWEPDIVLIQEAAAHRIKHIADTLYGGHGDYRSYAENGVITRWKITREVRNPDPRFRFFNHNVTVRLPDARTIEVVNLHLSSAATDLRLWERECWVKHRANRHRRQLETAVALRVLEETSPSPRPVILGGDFNAPPTDPIQRMIAPQFIDAFRAAGTGWGDTYHRRVPILRIDRIHATRQFKPVRCRAVTTRASDHRMVVADLLLEP